MTINGELYWADLDNSIDLSIPLDFNGPQPSHFGAKAASSEAFQVPGFTGVTHTGASCNVDELRLIPHCNGTHTETIGHILHERVTATDIQMSALIPAALVSVTPQPHHETSDSYDPPFEEDDMVISRQLLEQALERSGSSCTEALIVRTLPNPDSKKTRRYDGAAFFTVEAAQFMRERNVQHLVVDLPSVDRSHDEGYLSAHRIFWGVAPRSHETSSAATHQRTITELAFIPAHAPDASYLLTLGIPSFLSDAAPSRVSIVTLQRR